MMEKLKNSGGAENAIKRWIKSPEQPRLSKQMATFAETMHTLSPEELKTSFAEMIEKVTVLEKMSRTDDLTGLLSKRGFREEWDRYVSLLKREIE